MSKVFGFEVGLFDGLEQLDSHATDIESLEILFDLLLYVKPRVIVEAGTYLGHFAIPAARLLPESKVFTADVKAFAKFPQLPNLAVFEGDFEDMLRHVPFFDFAFVDSGPAPGIGTIEGIRLLHWKIAQTTINPEGLVVCHDTFVEDWTGSKEIIADGIRLQGGRGLTMWQRKEHV